MGRDVDRVKAFWQVLATEIGNWFEIYDDIIFMLYPNEYAYHSNSRSFCNNLDLKEAVGPCITCSLSEIYEPGQETIDNIWFSTRLLLLNE